MPEEITPEEEAELMKYLPLFPCGELREKLKTKEDIIKFARTMKEKIKKSEEPDKPCTQS
jgi:hypothetical protein